jgi:general secretion pathway protein C
MEIYLKRYFWVVPLLVAILCAIFAAMGTNHLIEAKYLLGQDKARAPKSHRPPPPPKALASKDADAVIQRNLFCSACDPPPPTSQPTNPSTGPIVDDGSRPPDTTLPLALLATSVTNPPTYSAAAIVNTQSGKQGLYLLGEDLPGTGSIVEISMKYVDFVNTSANRKERIELIPNGSPPVAVNTPAAPAASAASSAVDPDAAFLADVQKGVHKVDDTHYTIDRALVDKVLGDPTAVMRSARIVPSIQNGKANGFKMYAIRPNSPFALLGMQNGDTITTINGYDMSNPDKTLEAYTKLKSASNFQIDIIRRGTDQTMNYTIQ